MGTAFNAVTKAVSANNYKTKSSATILGAGNFVSGNITNDLSIAENSYHHGRNNGLPYAAGIGHDKALSSGTFAYGPKANKWVMLGNSVTTELSGVSNSVLKSGAAHFFRKRVHFKTTARTAFLSTLQWNSNEIEGPTYTLTISASNPNFLDDVAANLSRTQRSSLFYMVTGKLATETSYSSLSLW